MKTENTAKPFDLLKWTGLLAGICYYAAMIIRNDVPVDGGDGLQHFALAQNSWADPSDLLNHWGKPLFTLLASPLAQFGFKAYLFFNVIVYALTCILAGKLFGKLSVSGTYTFLFPLILIGVPDYSYCVLGGMTETLFGLICIALLYTGISKKWFLFAVIASFSLFSRSEGMFLLALSFAVLCFYRQWRAIPLLAAGSVVYAVAGYFEYGTLLWYFTNDPYTGYMVYGKGPWNHYILLWEQYLGKMLLILFPVSLFGWFVFHRRKDGPGAIWLLFAVAIFGGILITHSYLWANGLKGSLGLTRIASLGLPAFALVTLMGLDRITRELHMLPNALILILLSFWSVRKIRALPYPNQANGFEEILGKAAVFVKTNFPGSKVYYHHPMFAWSYGAQMKGDDKVIFTYFAADSNVINNMPEGSIIVRDPQFGPVEAGLPFEFVNSRKDLKLIKKITTAKDYYVYTEEPVEILIYQVKHRQ